MPRPHLIAIAGASGSGKTTLAAHLAAALATRVGPVPVVPIDAYYRDDPDETPEERAARNYDAPEAIDTPLLLRHVERLRGGHKIARPTYDFRTHRRLAATVAVRPAPHVLVEGLLALHWSTFRAHWATKVFISIDERLALERRLARDTGTRGRTEHEVWRQWRATVYPMYCRYVEPSRRFADLTVDGSAPVEESAAAVLALVRAAGGPDRLPR